jgi:hypothetical protein
MVERFSSLSWDDLNMLREPMQLGFLRSYIDILLFMDEALGRTVYDQQSAYYPENAEIPIVSFYLGRLEEAPRFLRTTLTHNMESVAALQTQYSEIATRKVWGGQAPWSPADLGPIQQAEQDIASFRNEILKQYFIFRLWRRHLRQTTGSE